MKTFFKKSKNFFDELPYRDLAFYFSGILFGIFARLISLYVKRNEFLFDSLFLDIFLWIIFSFGGLFYLGVISLTERFLHTKFKNVSWDVLYYYFGFLIGVLATCAILK